MFIDAHTHLDHFTLEEIDVIFSEIDSMPCQTWAVSMDLESWKKTQKLAAGRSDILPTFGIHPWNAHLFAKRLDELDDPVSQSKHIGEIGLDFHWVEEKDRWPLQEIVFDFFLQKAAEQNKIVNLHTKGAEPLVLEKLRKFNVEQVIIHWYSGDLDTYKAMVDFGCYFTFGVELPFNESIQACALHCPSDQLLTETDGPGALEWLNGERSRPMHLPAIVEFLADLRQENPKELQEQISQNYLNLLKKC